MFRNPSSSGPAAYKYNISTASYVTDRIKTILFRAVTANGLPLFLRGSDMISAPSLVSGIYEGHLVSLIRNLAANGYGDIFFDIGANIGVMSCQCGDFFKRVFAFEPNPDCIHITKVNTRLFLRKAQFKLFEFGLGDRKDNVTLNVPKGNWGGAYISDDFNTYTTEILAKKDGHVNFDANNYDKVEVAIESAKDVLRALFAQQNSDGMQCCVVKIDVEGCETLVLEALAASIPAKFRAAIVFENWDADADPRAIEQMFSGRASLFVVRQRPSNRGAWIFRMIKIALNGGISFALEQGRRGHCSGDLLLLVEPGSD